MEQLERIQYMEESLDLLSATLADLSKAAEQYQLLQPRLKELSDYYGGPLWRKDFDDDSEGKLPKTLKRGVLSEDAVYDFLSEHDSLIEKLRELLEH